MHLTAMSSTHGPMDITLTYVLQPPADYDVDVDSDSSDDASSEISYGEDLRVRIFRFPSATTLVITNGSFRMTSRLSSKETSIS